MNTAQKSPTMKEKLVLENIGLVQRIANKIAGSMPSHITADDIYSYGIFGLLEAVERYNPEYGIPFNNFASIRIKGAIIDGIRKDDWVPNTVRKKAKMIEEAYLNLESTSSGLVTDERVAKYLGISLEELRQWYASIQYITLISLDEPISEGENYTLLDNVHNQTSSNPEKTSEQNELKDMLVKAVGDLPDKERLVVTLYYYEDLSNKEIAKIMNLSDSRISQLHTKAILRMRGKLARLKKHI